MKYREAFRAWERNYLLEELAKANNHVSTMAKNIGVNRTNLYVVLARNGIVHKARAIYGYVIGGNDAWKSLNDRSPSP